ncbi:MAG: hypothetical protein WBL21_00185 [Salinimicrobium sp.]
MKNFKDYLDHVEKREMEIEAQQEIQHEEDERQWVFYDRVIIPALENIAEEHEHFDYEFRERFSNDANQTQTFDIHINDEEGFPKGRYLLKIRMEFYDRYKNLNINLKNFISKKEVEAKIDNVNLQPSDIEDCLTTLFIKLFEEDNK